MTDLTGRPHYDVTEPCIWIPIALFIAWSLREAAGGEMARSYLGMYVVAALLLGLLCVPWAFGVALAGWLVWRVGLRCWDDMQARRRVRATAVRARELALRDPNALVAFERLADAMEAQGRYPEALDALKRWQARDPLNREVRRRLYAVRRRLGPLG